MSRLGWPSRSAALYIVENTARGGACRLAAMTEPERAGRAIPGLLRVLNDGGAISELPGYNEGRFWVQDLSAVLMADLVEAHDGMTVLDACAAPGGKSFRLRSAGAVVTAVDNAKERLERLADNSARLGLVCATRQHDWSGGPLDKNEAFDAVLVDAPCTGLGVVGRKPEIRWRRTQADVQAASIRQQEILKYASSHVRPGGKLVYTVCSPEPEEGQEVVDAFIAAHPRFKLETSLSTAPPTQGEDAHYGVRMVAT